MASYPVTVYRWDDPGAPQFTDGRISNFFNILQKCLVEGYGDKDPLGWTRSYYDPVNFKAAWRNNVDAGGSGGSCYFYSNTNTDVNATSIRNTSCKSITDTGVITGQGRLTNLIAAANTIGWVLIGTKVGFYFYTFSTAQPLVRLSSSSSAATRISFYTGDILSVVPNDAGRFVMVSAPNSSGDQTGNNLSTMNIGAMSNSFQMSSGGIRVYDADNFNSFIDYGYTTLTQLQAANNDVTSAYPINPVNPVYISPVLISVNNYLSGTDRLGVMRGLSLISPGIRGCFPGLFFTAYPFGPNENLPYKIIKGVKEYYLLPSVSITGASYFLIQSNGSWDDPFI